MQTPTIVPGLNEFRHRTTIRSLRNEVPVRVSGLERAGQSVTHGVYTAVAGANHGGRDNSKRLQPLSRGSSCVLTTAGPNGVSSHRSDSRMLAPHPGLPRRAMFVGEQAIHIGTVGFGNQRQEVATDNTGYIDAATRRIWFSTHDCRKNVNT